MNAAEWPALQRATIDLGNYASNIPPEYGEGGLTLLQRPLLWEDFGQTKWPFHRFR